MEAFQTEFEFELPRGVVDEEGVVHREGIMRMATAADEIVPMRDPRVQSNPAYLAVILLSRVITRLGSMPAVNTRVIEGMYAADFQYLQEFYNRINEGGSRRMAVSCPHCNQGFEIDPEASPGES